MGFITLTIQLDVAGCSMGTRKTGPEDRELGRALAKERRALKLTQAHVADSLHISTQQYGKYERGENRLSVSRHKALMAIFEARSRPGLSDRHQSEYVGPVDRAMLQKCIDRMQKLGDEIRGTIAVFQRHVDHM